jgi:hypothetical protein
LGFGSIITDKIPTTTLNKDELSKICFDKNIAANESQLTLNKGDRAQNIC